MKPSDLPQGQLSSVNDNISPQSQVEPQVTKITRKIVTTTEPVTQTYITKKVITTTTRPSKPNVVQNTRYNNVSSTINKPSSINYTRPAVQNISLNNRNPTNNNNRSTNITSQAYRTNQNQRPVNQNSQNIQRVQNSKSYGGSRNQPKRPEIPSNYKPRITSPNPSSAKIKTINRGKPIENVQITHIIYSTKPLDFHIIEALNEGNLNSQPIQISEEKRNNLQKSGKIQVTCSCDNIEIKKLKPIDLTGKYTHYQHAQGIGMTDKKENINPQFYSSEIKTLDPLTFNKGEPHIEILKFRSNGNTGNTTQTITRTVVKPVVNYTTNRSNNIRSYSNTNQLKNNATTAKRGVVGTVKTTTSTSTTNYRGNTGSGNSGNIVKETTTQVKMGSRSQFNNQSKPIVTTTVDRKSYNQSNISKK